MKKVLILLVLVLSLVVFSSCAKEALNQQEPEVIEDKDFTGGGVKISLTTAFKEKKTELAEFYLESNEIIFMSNRYTYYDERLPRDGAQYKRSKDPMVYATDIVNVETIRTGVKFDGYPEDNYTANDGSIFTYISYTNTVDGIEYKYYMVLKFSYSYVYCMNFACLAKDYARFENLFFEYAKTIVVE